MTVYKPAEDSFLLKDYISKLDLQGKNVLDMGTGSGIIALEMARQGASVTAADINLEAVEETQKKAEKQGLEVKVKQSDLFENIDGKFDLITFNPPYLPGEEGVGDEEIWLGGKTGTEVTEEFLDQADQYLAEEGFAFTIISTRADFEKLVEKYDLKILEKKQLWFENLLIARYK